MPGGNKTGPWGAGSRTGRGMGFCAGYPVAGFMNWGFGGGRRQFAGRGFRRMFNWSGYPNWQPLGFSGANFSDDNSNDKESLKQTAEALKAQLDQINRRLEEMAGEN
ncbi:DUF5320 domain-containing protein [candidate division WOR-3 bacterium]|nr:DUF5320 domain-containing protein [candidate division WOR-3 bacterium]